MGGNPGEQWAGGVRRREKKGRDAGSLLPRVVNLSRRNAASVITLESEEWFDLHDTFLISDKAKALPTRIGSQTA